jgi:hypothetical protein
MEAANQISRLYVRKGWSHELKGLIHIDGLSNLNILKDYLGFYQDVKNFELNEFNIFQAAARTLYDKFPPHKYAMQPLRGSDINIALVGYNQFTEAFIVENMILSHYPDHANITVWIYHSNAEEIKNKLMYKYPFIRGYLTINTVTTRDQRFQYFKPVGTQRTYPKKNFNISYVFADDDAEVIILAKRFKQFLYAIYRDISESPIVGCMPENSSIIDLINFRYTEHEGEGSLEESLEKDFNIKAFHNYKDSCHKANLIDQIEINEKLARVINYFYSIQYDFSSEYENKHGSRLTKKQAKHINDAFLKIKVQGNDPLVSLEKSTMKILGEIDWELSRKFTITGRWQKLTDRKKDSNRYVARHLDIKLNLVGDVLKINEDLAAELAPLEHKRWCAEELVLGYRYADFPKDRNLKALLKNELKIHNLIIPFQGLSKENKKKDEDIFMTLPLLRNIRNILRKQIKS